MLLVYTPINTDTMEFEVMFHSIRPNVSQISIVFSPPLVSTHWELSGYLAARCSIMWRCPPAVGLSAIQLPAARSSFDPPFIRMGLRTIPVTMSTHTDSHTVRHVLKGFEASRIWIPKCTRGYIAPHCPPSSPSQIRVVFAFPSSCSLFRD